MPSVIKAQHCNAVKAMLLLSSPGLPDKLSLGQYALSYERKVIKDFGIQINFATYAGARYYEPLAWWEKKAGIISYRVNFRSFNIGAMYTGNIYRNRHLIKAHLGPTYTWGTNGHIKSYSMYGAPPDYVYCTVLTWYEKKADYWGVFSQIGYDYVFCKGRLTAGMDVRARRYRDNQLNRYEYGVHLGVCF